MYRGFPPGGPRPPPGGPQGPFPPGRPPYPGMPMGAPGPRFPMRPDARYDIALGFKDCVSI